MATSKALLNLLEPVLDAALRVLRDLEPEAVPAPVRKVAGYTGKKRMPPPYARSLYVELDGNDWLREKVTDAMVEADPDADDLRMAAAGLFLHRPDGWQDRFDELLADQEENRLGSEVASLEQTLERMKISLEASREKERRVRGALEDLRAETEKKLKEFRAAADAARASAAEPTTELQRAVDRGEAEIARLREELREADARVDSLKTMLLRERRVEREGFEGSTPAVWTTGDALERARLLDEVMAAMRPRTTGAEIGVHGPGALDIPDGIRPDQIDAIRWMLQLERPVTLVVDGYNVSFQLDESRFSTPDLRDRVREELVRLRRLAAGPMPVVLVFDSSEEEATIPGPVEVRFVPSADDEIVRLAAQLPGDVVVVSTDREVRERAEMNGAIALWSDALVGWMKGR